MFVLIRTEMCVGVWNFSPIFILLTGINETFQGILRGNKKVMERVMERMTIITL